jgi:UDP-glucose 4-epimerase
MPERAAAGSVLVTGGSGFIGTALVRALRASGAPVTVVDQRPSTDPTVEMLLGDLTDPALLEEIVARRPSAIFHLAARTSVLESVRDPMGVYVANVDVTQRLLEVARVAGTSTFVLASTNAVVGPVDASSSINENMVLRPLTPYGGTKAAAEMLCAAYAASYGIAVAPVRLTNVYGLGMTEKDSFVARLMRAAATGSTVTIYGDGRQVRDYVFVDDAVAGLMLAWRHQLREPIVIGSGTSTSVIELHDLVRSVTGQTLDAVDIDPPGGEMPAVRVDLSRARMFGYEPSVDLREGLARTWASWPRSPSVPRPAGG